MSKENGIGVESIFHKGTAAATYVSIFRSASCKSSLEQITSKQTVQLFIMDKIICILQILYCKTKKDCLYFFITSTIHIFYLHKGASNYIDRNAYKDIELIIF